MSTGGGASRKSQSSKSNAGLGGVMPSQSTLIGKRQSNFSSIGGGAASGSNRQHSMMEPEPIEALNPAISKEKKSIEDLRNESQSIYTHVNIDSILPIIKL